MKTISLAILAAIGLMPLALAGEPSGPLQDICNRLCGSWAPEAPTAESPQLKLHLTWDQPSGELRGEKISTGWEGGGAASTVKIGFRYDAKAEAVWFFAETDGLGRLESTVMVEPDAIRIVGLMPGKPDLSAVTIYTVPAHNRLYEVLAESGQQYNNTVLETDFVREKD